MCIVVEDKCCIPPTVLGEYHSYDEAMQASALLEDAGIQTKIIKEEKK